MKSETDWTRFGAYYIDCPHGEHNIRVIESAMVAAEKALMEEHTRRQWVKEAQATLALYTWH